MSISGRPKWIYLPRNFGPGKRVRLTRHIVVKARLLDLPLRGPRKRPALPDPTAESRYFVIVGCDVAAMVGRRGVLVLRVVELRPGEGSDFSGRGMSFSTRVSLN